VKTVHWLLVRSRLGNSAENVTDYFEKFCEFGGAHAPRVSSLAPSSRKTFRHPRIGTSLRGRQHAAATWMNPNPGWLAREWVAAQRAQRVSWRRLRHELVEAGDRGNDFRVFVKVGIGFQNGRGGRLKKRLVRMRAVEGD
jgi:hypothetical protein